MPSFGQNGGAMNDSLAQHSAQTPSPSTGSRQATHSVGSAISSASRAACPHAPRHAFSAPRRWVAIERDGDTSASMGVRLASGLFPLKRRIPAQRAVPAARYVADPGLLGKRTNIEVVLQKGRKSRNIRVRSLLWIPAQCDPLDLGFGRFFPGPILEDDMATFTRSQSLLVSAATSALGGAALATLLAGNIVTRAGAGATAADISPSFAGADFPVCHTPATTGSPMMLRLTQTEVPRAEMSAASSAPAFEDSEPPLWAGLASITYKATTANERAPAYFDQCLRLAYAFNHGDAQRAIRMAQKLDPDCATCFWGEALVLGPNINLPMQEDAAVPAYAAAQKAKALTGQARP